MNGMSFSSEVKEELAERIGTARHCRLAELSAIYTAQEGALRGDVLVLKREPVLADRKFFTILKKTYTIDADLIAEGEIKGKREELQEICDTLKKPTVLSACCRRAYLRGVFLCAGSVNDPSKSYHLEMACRDSTQAETVSDFLAKEEIRAGRTERGGRHVVYVKGSDRIVTLLGLMEAGRALLKMENERVMRDVRGNVNRRVNLETANIGKAADASARQIEAIRFLEKHGGTEDLPASLQEMAAIRIRHPEATLEELGSCFRTPVGKSGVNHRLRRLIEAARVRGFESKEEEEETLS